MSSLFEGNSCLMLIFLPIVFKPQRLYGDLVHKNIYTVEENCSVSNFLLRMFFANFLNDCFS